MDAEWNSSSLYVLYQVIGWFAFTVWSVSFYPQVILNFRRKSVVGLNFDFVLLNLTKHTSYLVYNACMFFIPVVQYQYHLKYGFSELIPVALSDVAFSIHAVLLTWITAYQVFIYERGAQKLSKTASIITIGAWLAAVICLIIAWPQGKWLWLVSDFNIIQVVMTLIKYIPQAWMNYQLKSTVGWSIGNILLDLSGGVANFLQMGVQSIDQGSTQNFSGNIGKLLLSLIVIAFDLLFIVQHYILYWRSRVSSADYYQLDVE
ncbi:hypothetical protein KP509_35G028900 [Ceratopteris richardii]|uniref:Cystinosin homolog n=1 Tax=Ceratopteris richardii TaxID=49495 RepID=A0A8T2QFA6_CERRI|nr:hypothetical protein KP509_35G028900 [Ceratopteris richardii]